MTDQFIPPPYTWTPVPGTDNVEIYHIVRKPSVLCSNTYIIKVPELFIVIDPGTDREQIEHGRQVILEKRQGQSVPVFLFLTHCHIDHFLAVNLLMDQSFNGQFICHPLAADAIEAKDENLTLANMNGSVLPMCKVRDRFFHDKESSVPAEESTSVSKAVSWSLTTGRSYRATLSVWAAMT
jgi:glyoxylase-like metal-dependent hydrolase (beta-lactamase superfamily II)